MIILIKFNNVFVMKAIIKIKQKFANIVIFTGSGKSCLLNILSGRISCSKNVQPKLEGQVMYDYNPVNYTLFRKQTAYISQDDQLFSYLTVEETFMLAAYFNLPRNISKENIVSAVNLLITQLNLNKVRHTIIGSASRRGVSGGERKRVAIGKELLSNPSILFLDEPTSGIYIYIYIYICITR